MGIRTAGQKGGFLSVAFLLVLLATNTWAAVRLTYWVSMEKPHTHYFDVSLTIQGARKPYLDFKMPVWIPGSYLIREFERHVQDFQAFDAKGRSLRWEKITKNTWRVYSQRAPSVTVRYRVYAFEISVRTSFLDDSHAFINGPSVFMFVEGYLDRPITVHIRPYTGWNRISTGLESDPDDPFALYAPNYDVLVDCPIEIGTHQVLEFTVDGIPHQVALYGQGNFQPDSLIKDMRRIVETARQIVGEIPYRRYVFIVHLLHQGGGGLEHRNSCVLQVSRWTFQPESAYRGFLGLVAHEYFHVWNVKNIRPCPLGPFNYDAENYTRLLWIAEGFTTYYAGQIMLRAGYRTPQSYLDGLASRVRYLRSTPGNRVQTLEYASFDAWIKAYRPDENSINTTISYYGKGAVIATLLDLAIRHHSQNQRSLDDVFRALYRKYYKEADRCYTEEDFKAICEEMAGTSLNEIFQYVHTTREIDFDKFLQYAGLRLVLDEAQKKEEGYLGVRVSDRTGKAIVTQVLAGSPAYEYGLNVDDEIIAVDGYRVEASSFAKRIAEKKPGQRITLTISRRGLLRELEVVLGERPNLNYRIERVENPSDLQRTIYESWLHTSWDK